MSLLVEGNDELEVGLKCLLVEGNDELEVGLK